MVSGMRLRLLAVLETLLVFGSAVACFRWMAGLEALNLQTTLFTGRNVWPYLALWLFTPVLLILTRRNLALFGLVFRPIQNPLAVAAAGFIPFFILSVALSWIAWNTWGGSALIALIEVGLLAATAWFLRKHPDWNVSLPLVAGALLLPLVASQAGRAVASLGYAYLLVAPAEEMLFRGYIQTRLDLAFGRPYNSFGIRWGAGLVCSALLFGLWHLAAVNVPIWPQALWTVFLGLMLGIVREKSSSLLAPSLLHGVVNYGPQAFLYDLFF